MLCKNIYTALVLFTERKGIKNMNGKFLHDMLVNWLYSGIRTLLFLWWAITVEPALKGTCLEGNRDHLSMKTRLVLSQKRCDILS